MIYEFKVTLKDVGVPVWRTIQIDGNSSLYELHQLLQATFEWFDFHLHNFEVRRTDGKAVEGIEISSDDEFEEFESLFATEKYDEEIEILADWFIKVKDKMIYTYDYGDDWKHEIVLQKIVDRDEDALYPRCVDAKNLAPDEDSRGEVIIGEVDLEYEDTDELIEAINDDIGFEISGEQIENYWPQTLEKAKEFQQLKPWEVMNDEQIFAVEDPDTGEYLFCCVLGQAEELHGLAVYVGADGFFSLIDILNNEKS